MTDGLRRAFVAVVPPAPVLDAVDALLDRKDRRRFRWTTRAQWHLTLQYFGRVDEVDALVAALREALEPQTPFAVQLRGGGAFPAPKRAQVLWLGADDDGMLGELAFAVRGRAAAFIARRDLVPFRAHLTLARLPSKLDLTADVDALERVPIGPRWRVGEALLLESETRSDGAVYREVARVELRG